MKSIKAYIGNREGTAAVEFGLIAIAFVSIILATFETGRFFLAQNAFQYALESATRYALVNTDATEEELEDLIEGIMDDMAAGDDSLTVSVDLTESGGVDFIEVDGSYLFQAVSPMLPDSWGTITLTANSRMPFSPDAP